MNPKSSRVDGPAPRIEFASHSHTCIKTPMVCFKFKVLAPDFKFIAGLGGINLSNE